MTGDRRHGRVVGLVSLVVLFMLGLTALSVPLYRRFCQQTGYGGATERAAAAPTRKDGKVIDRIIRVQFDSNVNPQLPWRFKPNQAAVDVAVGETAIASYHAQNLGALPVTGTATYNVQPDKIGRYFVKIQCFCFTEQTLSPGQDADLPVMFYIDPKIMDDPDLADIKMVTLSYTFFKAESKALEKYVQSEK